MSTNHPTTRRRRETQFAPEALETRSLLTAGAGNTFAIVSGEITKAGQPAAVKFTIDPTHFHLPKGRFTLGIDVASDPTAKLVPQISAVSDSKGHPVPHMTHSVYGKHLQSTQVTAGQATSAVLTPVHLNNTNPNAPATYTVNVKGTGGTTGKFLLGFYLPGDVKGEGKVTQDDVNTVRSALGVQSGSSRYSFDADVNRDGRIAGIDLSTTRQNLGVTTDVSPVISANLDHADETMPNDRVLNKPNAHFTGDASPGATVTFTEINNKSQSVTSTADAQGHYNLYAPLAAGANTFRVTTLDPFGQSITGSIAPVTYINPAQIMTLASLTNAKK